QSFPHSFSDQAPVLFLQPLCFFIPAPPRWRPRDSCMSTNRGNIYFNLATSTCSLDSRVLTRFAKISKISIVRPITSQSNTFSKFRRSEEHTSELQSRFDLVCRLLLEKKKIKINLINHNLLHYIT